MFQHGLIHFGIQNKSRLKSAKNPIPLGKGMAMNMEKTTRIRTVTKMGETSRTHFLLSPRTRMNART
jgi:hypothetical protein